METKRAEGTAGGGWQRDYFAQPSIKVADLEDGVAEGYYLNTRTFNYTDKDGEEREGVSHLILSKKADAAQPTKITHIKGAAALNRWLDGVARGMAVRIVFVEKHLNAKGAPENVFDMYTNPGDVLDRSLYPDVVLP